MKIRKATPKDYISIAKVHVDGWKSRYKGILSDRYLDSLKYEKRQKSWKEILSSESETAYVLETSDNQIIGFVSYNKSYELQEYKGEIHALYLLDQYQGHGYGKQLIQTAINELVKLDIDSMIIWALEANPTCALYEKLGGTKVNERIDNIGTNDYRVICYGYKNIQNIFNQTNSIQNINNK